MRQTLTVVAIAAVLSGCATTTRDHTPFIEKSYAEATPVVAPVRAQTNFSHALVCMDRMLKDAGIRDVHVASKYFADPSGKAGTATDQLVATALSEMSVESHAFRFVENEVDQLKQDTVQSLGQMLINGDAMTVRAPDIYVHGAVSYIDQNVSSNRKSFGLSGPAFDVGVDRDVIVSQVSLDMRLGDFRTKSMFPGVHSSNTLAAAKAGAGNDAGGKIKKFGVTFAVGTDFTNGTGAAVRTLVEFGMVELVGKWAKLPYWKCLAVDQGHPEFQRELAEWYARLPAAQRVRVVQAALGHAGYYHGPVDGRETLELRDALGQFQADKSITPTGMVNFETYEKLVRDYVVVDSQGRFVRAEWLKAMHEGGKPDFRLGANKPSDSGLAAPQAPDRPVPLAVNLMPSRPDRQYRVGDLIDVAVSVSRASYLRCYLRDVEGRVAQIYPNRFQTAEFVPARRAVRIPDAGVAGFVLEFDKEGTERILCIASDTDLAAAMPQAWRTASLTPIPGLRSLEPIEQFATNALGAGRVGVASVELRSRK